MLLCRDLAAQPAPAAPRRGGARRKAPRRRQQRDLRLQAGPAAGFFDSPAAGAPAAAPASNGSTAPLSAPWAKANARCAGLAAASDAAACLGRCSWTLLQKAELRVCCNTGRQHAALGAGSVPRPLPQPAGLQTRHAQAGPAGRLGLARHLLWGAQHGRRGGGLQHGPHRLPGDPDGPQLQGPVCGVHPPAHWQHRNQPGCGAPPSADELLVSAEGCQHSELQGDSQTCQPGLLKAPRGPQKTWSPRTCT